ncbi:hypothetical protein MPH_06242 [Macrophomina phaseolina MS6]|uniref:Uncharacterized protein n=1 Tax=Macrophomina phaseolina (strain MS6) TaxID=1126212 RepID=K2R2H8_MACPH|nr:hypothetical protein MPH_06242 [Macrophomina phaseolina MS6]
MDSLSSVIQLPPPHSNAPTDDKESRNYLLFFIPGCPGPVAYYGTFLSNLHVALNSATSSSVEARFEVLGRSLASRNDGTAAVDKLPSSTSAMIGEIELLEAALLDRVDELAAGEKGGVLPKVILVGHGAGGYIALELMKRLQPNSSTAKAKRIELAGTVCLFPSVSMKSVAGTVSQAVVSLSFVSSMLARTTFVVPRC